MGRVGFRYQDLRRGEGGRRQVKKATVDESDSDDRDEKFM